MRRIQKMLSMLVVVVMLATSMDVTVLAEGIGQDTTVSGNEIGTEVVESPVLVDESEDVSDNAIFEETEDLQEVTISENSARDSEDDYAQEHAEEFVTSESSTEEAVTASGKCGDNLTWTLVDGVLTISGTGEMHDYYIKWNSEEQIQITTAPWGKYYKEMQTVVIENGITYIGDYAFSGCYGFVGELKIPDSVKTIGEAVFQHCKGFTGDLVIPDSVTQIGWAAFSECSGFNGKLVIPKNVSELSGTFGGCSGLTGELILPEGIKKIGTGVFNGCSGFTGDLKIPDTVLEIGYRAFNDCDGFDGKLVLGSGVKVIGQDAFYNLSNLTGELVLPEGLITIGESAFSGCSGFTGDLVIPDSVTTIERAAFLGCTGFTGNLKLSNELESIGHSVFRYCNGFTGNLIIPNNVKEIGIYAFLECSGFTGDLIIPDSVISIEEEAFEGCSGFNKTLVIGDGVVFVKDKAFYGCSGFTQLEIGDNVSSIGKSTFEGCNGLSGSLMIGINVMTIESGAFYGCNYEKVYIPSSVISIATSFPGAEIYGVAGSYAETYAKEQGNRFIEYDFEIERLAAPFSNIADNSNVDAGTNIELSCIEEDVTIYYTLDGTNPTILSTSYTEPITIFEDTILMAFAVKPGCQNSEIVCYNYFIQASDNIVGGDCGSKIDNVKWSLNKETGVLTLYGQGEMAAYDTVGPLLERESTAPWMEYKEWIKILVIKKGITSIGNNAFCGCTFLTGDLILPEGLKYVNQFAFTNCTGLNGKLIFPESIISIGQSAFNGCSNLKGDLILPDSITKIELAAFSKCSGFNGKLKLPQYIEVIESSVFDGCTNLTGKLNIPDSVVKISSYAFGGCEQITGDLVIPEKVYEIGGAAFENCIGLEGATVYLSDNIQKIGQNVFYKWGYKNGQYYYGNLDITIKCNPGTYAEKWAKENGFIEKSGKIKISQIPDQSFTGTQVKPKVEVFHDEKLLEEGKDYTLTYKNNVNAGENTARVIVKGKGNYSGQSEEKSFTIKPKEITSENIQAQSLTPSYNGKVQKPSPTIMVDGKKLAKNKNYILSYSDTTEGAYKDAGTWNITVSGKGNYTGEVTVTFRILDSTEVLATKLSVSKIATVNYEEGQKAEPKPAVSYKGNKLVEGQDYSLSYSSNDKAGKATLTITGLEKEGKVSVVGTCTKTFTIKGTAISKAKVEYSKTQPFTGSQICPEVKLTVDKGTTILREGTDYSVSYGVNTKVGKGTIIITGMGGYTGTIKKTFTIQAINMATADADIQIKFVDGAGQNPYALSGVKPEVEVYWGETKLESGADYTVSYKNNKAVKDATATKAPTVTVKGKGNYKGSKSVPFTIIEKDLTDSDITISVPDKVYNAKGKYQSTPVVTDSEGKKLKAGKNYKIVGYYVDGREMPSTSVLSIGTEITVKIEGIGSYKNGREVTYRISERDISKATIKISDVEYTGGSITFTEEDFTNGNIKVSGPKGVEAPVYGEDFIISGYKNNINKGTAQVTFKGISDEWGGSKTVKFKIKAKNLK